ncbi:Uncharacterised protein [Streptococcus pneumoniae]|nr:Uncharacterised protein [Streptococcus pneumoniae]CWI13976.1 Uncharacterised protein [Streptococcus pneumoniae]
MGMDSYLLKNPCLNPPLLFEEFFALLCNGK